MVAPSGQSADPENASGIWWAGASSGGTLRQYPSIANGCGHVIFYSIERLSGGIRFAIHQAVNFLLSRLAKGYGFTV